jgi:hypothetical protein
MRENGKDAILMQKLSGSKRSFPRALCFIHKTVTAALAEEEPVLFVDLLLQLFWIGALHLVDQTLELMIHLSFGFQKDTVEVGEDPDMGHVNKTPRGESLPAPPAFTFFHGFILLDLKSHGKVIKLLSH